MISPLDIIIMHLDHDHSWIELLEITKKKNFITVDYLQVNCICKILDFQEKITNFESGRIWNDKSATLFFMAMSVTLAQVKYIGHFWKLICT